MEKTASEIDEVKKQTRALGEGERRTGGGGDVGVKGREEREGGRPEGGRGSRKT